MTIRSHINSCRIDMATDKLFKVKVSVYWYLCTRQEPAAGYHCCEGCEARRRLRAIGGR